MIASLQERMAGDSGGVLSRLAVVVAVRGLDGVGQLGASEIPRAHQIPTPAPTRHIHLGLVPRQSSAEVALLDVCTTKNRNFARVLLSAADNTVRATAAVQLEIAF